MEAKDIKKGILPLGLLVGFTSCQDDSYELILLADEEIALNQPQGFLERSYLGKQNKLTKNDVTLGKNCLKLEDYLLTTWFHVRFVTCKNMRLHTTNTI